MLLLCLSFGKERRRGLRHAWGLVGAVRRPAWHVVSTANNSFAVPQPHSWAPRVPISRCRGGIGLQMGASWARMRAVVCVHASVWARVGVDLPQQCMIFIIIKCLTREFIMNAPHAMLCGVLMDVHVDPRSFSVGLCCASSLAGGAGICAFTRLYACSCAQLLQQHAHRHLLHPLGRAGLCRWW